MRMFFSRSGAAALVVVVLLAATGQADVISGTTYTYLNNEVLTCCAATTPDTVLVGGVYGSGWLNNGAFGDQAYMNGPPRATHAGGAPGWAYQIEGDEAFNGGTTAQTGGVFVNEGPLQVQFDLGLVYNLTTLTVGLVSETFHEFRLPSTITVTDGTNTVTDTTFTGAPDTDQGLYPYGQYVNHAIDISSLSGQRVTITLAKDHTFVSLLEAQFEGFLGNLGDFNDDTVVDTLDFGILRDHLYGHIEGPVGYADGDINFDGKVDLSDFGEFKALYPGGVAAATSVPEPASLALALGALAGMTALLRRRPMPTRHIEN